MPDLIYLVVVMMQNSSTKLSGIEQRSPIHKIDSYTKRLHVSMCHFSIMDNTWSSIDRVPKTQHFSKTTRERMKIWHDCKRVLREQEGEEKKKVATI